MKPLVFRRAHGAQPGQWREWVQKLGNASGVYVIRSKRSREVLYVGESHTGQLYSTLTRHFQSWSGAHAGTTYQRESVEVAVRTMPPKAAIRHQAELIRKLEPRDNTHHVPSEDEPTNADDFRDDW
jgi:hypothetical protein